MKFLVAALVVVVVGLTGCGSSKSSDNSGNQDPNQKAQQISFESWQPFVGVYRLLAFDDVDVVSDHEMMQIKAEPNRYTGSAGSWMRLINFHLYSSYTPNSSQSWNFGPLDQVGTSYVVTGDVGTKYVYDVSNAQVRQGGTTFMVNLHLEVLAVGPINQPGSTLYVSYTLVIPGIGENSSHNFVLGR